MVLKSIQIHPAWLNSASYCGLSGGKAWLLMKLLMSTDAAAGLNSGTMWPDPRTVANWKF
eukprot:m.40971 g.40971  ORF g.40971 m.40971 type:complete len:60 (-) comp12795_c0_seq1:1440-1619(-)